MQTGFVEPAPYKKEYLYQYLEYWLNNRDELKDGEYYVAIEDKISKEWKFLNYADDDIEEFLSELPIYSTIKECVVGGTSMPKDFDKELISKGYAVECIKVNGSRMYHISTN